MLIKPWASIEEQGFLQNFGRIAPRDREVAFAVIARSPCDEAIHSFLLWRDGLLRGGLSSGGASRRPVGSQ
jgi:hypothetical protein